MAQNLARENLQRAQQKMKDYYDQSAKESISVVGQRVRVYTPRTKKGSVSYTHLTLPTKRIV